MKNKNDTPIGEISKNQGFDSFPYREHFKHIADIEPNKNTESAVAKVYDNRFGSRRSVVYIFVIDGYIQKIGSTTTTMKDRLSSYNCGKQAYRDNGTCSTTNYFVLQSILKLNKTVEVYAFFPEKLNIEVDVFGEKVKKELPVPAKDYEKKILSEMKESNGGLPILCTQV